MTLRAARLRVDYLQTYLVRPMGIMRTILQKGDTRPVFTAQLVEPDGTPTVLLGKTVRMVVRDSRTRVVVVNQPAVAVDNEGRVRYAWQAADTARAGDYQLRLVVEDGTGGVASYPNADWHPLRIEP